MYHVFVIVQLLVQPYKEQFRIYNLYINRYCDDVEYCSDYGASASAIA